MKWVVVTLRAFLLADEVGLGKTIEAGMIIHQQVLSGRAERILIVVPETLQHQWLVEMMRRFNLHFSIFDEERCIEAFAESDNPFDTQQYVLCSLDFLRKSRKRYEQALEGEWDLLVVDEAHHLEWSQDKPSREYQVVEGLSENTSGVLLLTATLNSLVVRATLRVCVCLILIASTITKHSLKKKTNMHRLLMR